MPTEPHWLDPREDRAWRAFRHAHHQLTLRLDRHLLQDSGLTEADYEILAVLSGHPTGRFGLHVRSSWCCCVVELVEQLEMARGISPGTMCPAAGGGELCAGQEVRTHAGRSSPVRGVHVPSGAGMANVFSSPQTNW